MNTKLKKHPHPRPDQEVSPPEPRSKGSEHKESTLPDALKVVDGAAKKITEFQDKVDTIESTVHDEITTVKEKLGGFEEVKELLDNSMGWIKKLSKKYVKDEVSSGNKIGSNNFWGHLAIYFVQIFSIITALDLFTDVESIIKVALASGSVILIGSIKAWAQQAINKQKKQSDSIR